MNKKVVLSVVNISFICLFFYMLFILLSFKQGKFNAQEILKNSIMQEKTFEAKVEEINTEDGIKAWLMEEKSAPLVALVFYFDKAGYAFEKENKTGVSSMLSAMLEHGAGDFNEEEYHKMLDLNAVSIDFNVTDSRFQISLMSPSANLSMAAKLLKSVLTKPHLDEKDIKTTKLQQIEALKMKEEKPENILSKAFREKFYANHPLSREPLGNIENISKLSKKDLQDFMKKHFTKDNLVVAMAGDISKENAISFLKDVFTGLPTSGNVQDLPEVEANYTFEEENIERDIPQVISVFVAPGVKRLAEDFYPLYVANEIFGGSGLSSRLNLAMREKEGLTYGAYTYLNTSKKAPSIRGTFSTSKENYNRMKTLLFDEWKKMAEKGVSKEEFEAMKNHMLTSFNLRFTSIADIAEQLLYMQKEDLGIDFLEKRNEYVNKITLDELNNAAKKYFSNIPSVLTTGNN